GAFVNVIRIYRIEYDRPRLNRLFVLSSHAAGFPCRAPASTFPEDALSLETAVRPHPLFGNLANPRLELRMQRGGRDLDVVAAVGGVRHGDFNALREEAAGAGADHP